MKGALKREQMRADADLALAYMSAAFNSAGRAGKLKPLAHYQRKAGQRGVRQTPQEMLSVFRQLQARGAPMTIRRIERTPG